MIPKQILLRGAPELEPLLLPNGFHSVPWGRAQFRWRFYLGRVHSRDCRLVLHFRKVWGSFSTTAGKTTVP